MPSTDRANVPRSTATADPDPYPNYAWLRQRSPVSVVFSPHGIGKTWLVTSYELGRVALADPRLSNDSRNGADPVRAAAGEDDNMARDLLGLDGIEHARLRRMVTGLFTAHAVRRWQDMIEQVCARAIDAFATAGTADLVADFALPVPVGVIHEVLGVPDHQRKDPARCFDLFFRGGLALPHDPAAYEELIAYTDHLLDYKRRHPGDDVASHLVRLRDAGELRDERELRSMLLGLLGAGHVTTVQFFGCGLLRLLTDPALLDRLTVGETSWSDAVNEVLRIDPPIQATVHRYAVEDLEIGDVTVRRGDAVLISVGAANRDPGRFHQPDVFDTGRGNQSHLAFGHGAHLCLGVHLARLEGEIGLRMLMQRLDGLRLAIAPQEVVWSYGPMLRGPRELPVTFTPATRPA